MRLSGRTFTTTAILGASLALTTGCESIKDHRGYYADSTLIASVQPGIDNRQSVEKTLGRPTFTSEFGTPSWYYVATNTSQAPFGRPRVTEQSILKVNFDPAGNVSAVNLTGKEKVVNLSPDGDKTPTLGRERSFFQDLFGNIGAVGAGGGAPQGGGPGGPNGS
jgi:outer membrane protein assembly factor BamE (lipoprotein component of BamABCDE complex)